MRRRRLQQGACHRCGSRRVHAAWGRRCWQHSRGGLQCAPGQRAALAHGGWRL